MSAQCRRKRAPASGSIGHAGVLHARPPPPCSGRAAAPAAGRCRAASPAAAAPAPPRRSRNNPGFDVLLGIGPGPAAQDQVARMSLLDAPMPSRPRRRSAPPAGRSPAGVGRIPLVRLRNSVNRSRMRAGTGQPSAVAAELGAGVVGDEQRIRANREWRIVIRTRPAIPARCVRTRSSRATMQTGRGRSPTSMPPNSNSKSTAIMCRYGSRSSITAHNLPDHGMIEIVDQSAAAERRVGSVPGRSPPAISARIRPTDFP